jgi:outer membrane protein assembly factor BamB
MNPLSSIQRLAVAAAVVAILGATVLFSACSNPRPTQQAQQPTHQSTTLPTPNETQPSPATRSTRAANGPPAGTKPSAETMARFWRMFGGTPQRNMVNVEERNLPAQWNIGNEKKKIPAQNIKWVAELGSQSYGNPVVYGGKLFLGTNNGSLKNPRDHAPGKKDEPEDKGILMCFREADGQFLWQAVHDKHPAGRVVDWPEQGICSSPYVDGDRVYYVSNRCELICADVEGFANGNQGVQDEQYKDKIDADIIWRLDMMEELGVFPHNLAVCSPVIVGELVFIVTGNGHDESHENIPAPKAPSFIAVNKKDGKLVWHDNSPGEKILHGQWSNPCYAEINGRPQVIFPGGDGWLYAFEPASGKLLWKFDCNPKASKYILGGKGTRNEIIATPVVYDNKVYVAVGQDPEHGEGVGHLWCIDPSKASATNIDLSPVNDNFDPKAPENKNSGLVWHVGGTDAKGELLFRRSLSTCAVHDGLCYAANLSGFLVCFDAQTGQKYWEHDTFSAIWGSPYVVDGKVYIGTDEGSVYVFAHGKQKQLLARNDMRAPVLSTPIAVNGVLYVMTRSHLYAIANK